jgi:prepilin-type N-terminal cleavage/methylation domain-containing protein
VSQPANRAAHPAGSSERGFSLIETMVSLTLLLVVSAGMMEAMLQFSRTQSTVFNRSAMHNGVRSATELLQQEVGQAGHVTLPAPGPVTLQNAVAAGANWVAVSSTTGMFVGEQVDVGMGALTETVTIEQITSGNVFATFLNAHPAAAPVAVRGGFASGVVPCATVSATGPTSSTDCPGSGITTPTYVNGLPLTTTGSGSTAYLLKLYGDINDDGQIVYIEYKCDIGAGILYRNVIQNAVVTGTTPTKPAPGPTQILLDNLTDPDSGRVPCFTYQQKNVGTITFVTNVAISLTTQTQFRDRVTRQFQQETKSLLNVAPRNVFDAWLLASMGAFTRVQPMPPSIRSLLPTP